MQVSPEPAHGPLVDKVRLRNPFFANSTIFQMAGGNTTMELPRKVSHGVTTVATETGARSEQTAPTFGTQTLRAFDHYTDQRATQTWLDSVAGSEELLLDWIYDDLFYAAELLMVNGTQSTTQSQGFYSNHGASGYHVDETAASGVVANSDLFQMYFSLSPKYRAPAKWYMAGATLAGLTVLAHPAAADTPLITMNGDGTPILFGKPIVEVESASSTASGEIPIGLSDMANAYAIGVHRAVSILRDPYSAAPYVRYYGILRAGGVPWDRQAAVLLSSGTH